MTLPPYQQYQAFKEGLLSIQAKIEHVTVSFSPSSLLETSSSETQAKLATLLREADVKLAAVSACVAPKESVSWEARSIAEEANLLLDERRIMNEQGLLGDRAKYRPTWNDITKLTSTLSSLKSKGYISGKDAMLLDKVSANLSKACFEARELQRVSEALSAKLNEEMEQHGLGQELAKYEQVLQDLMPDVENCESLFEAAMLNGDVRIAEEIAYNQLALQERMINLVEDQYPAIQNKQADAKEFRRQRRWAIFRTAGNDINGVVELKSRQIEACEEDLVRLVTAMRERTTISQQNELKLESDRVESNKFLQSNLVKQKNAWGKMEKIRNEMAECEADIQALQNERAKEVQNVLEKEEAFADFKALVHGFLAGADKYMGRLQMTLDNSRLARELCGMLQEFMLGGCSTQETKFDKADTHLAEMEAKVDKQFLKHATAYFLNVGRLHHKKEAKIKALNEEIENAQVRLEFCVDSLDPMAKRHAQTRETLLKERLKLNREASVLSAKLDHTRKTWNGVSTRLTATGVPFADPELVLAKSHIIRHQRILDMRETLNVTEDKVGNTLDRESTTIQRDREMFRLRMMETQKAKKASVVMKAPRPPANAQMQAHNKASSRYSQMVTDLKLDEISEYTKSVTQQRDEENGGKTLHEMVMTVAAPSATTIAAARKVSSAAVLPPHDLGALLGRSLVARFTYKARAPDELSFVKGDVIVCLSQGQEEGWFVGTCNQRNGLFPFNYVNVVSEEDEFNF